MWSGKCPGKCLSGEMSSRGNVLRESVRSGNCPHTKLSQLIKQHEKHFFMKNDTQNVVRKLLPGSFLKNQNWIYLWINNLKIYFYCRTSWGASKYDEIKAAWFYKAFYIKLFYKKTQKGLELVSRPHFLHDFWRKIFL